MEKEETKKPIDFLSALRLVIEKTRPIQKNESVSLFDAVGRYIAEDVICAKALPAFTNSAMDGYGVKITDVGKTIPIVGSVFAGDDASGLSLKDGEAIKIMTGAPVPSGVDVVVPFENAKAAGDDWVTLGDQLQKGANIRRQGEEADIGDVLLRAGERLTPAAVGLLASQGMFVVSVYMVPRIAVLSSGNEIIEPWQKAQGYQIYNSNASTLIALCKAEGCDVHYVRLIEDTYEATRETIRGLQGYDAVLTTGGISMGEADFIAKSFVYLGLDIVFQKIQLKPGKPTLFGYLGDTAVLALPGNPLSAVANFYLFALPLLAKLQHARACYANIHMAKSKTAFSIKTSRANLLVGYLSNGEFEVYNHNKYGSGMLKPVVECNAFIVTGEDVAHIEAGQMLKVVLIGAPMIEYYVDMVNVEK